MNFWPWSLMVLFFASTPLAEEQFTSVSPIELGPGDPSLLPLSQEFLAGGEVRHPDVIAVGGHVSAPEPSSQDPKPILALADA